MCIYVTYPLDYFMHSTFIAVDCIWGTWSSKMCNTSCGTGHIVRKRKRVQEVINTGKACEGLYIEHQEDIPCEGQCKGNKIMKLITFVI